ncbi:Lrp/AsnC family transcriptional regulator [Butyrivibrio sp. XBB1001]|uniref:Lrp/AsnC family transcriptional regulator n=1 Tax=Butyrivibrio sp. XBB1001 TaxID=1280682 RepID=UPI0003FD6D9B|nr:winged helix-turn-helix transcriptional regulator [Butyrivibrio sp. XBB1001]
MDKKDEKIIKLIRNNARMSYQEIGDAIGMSRVAAKKRMDKLEREGVIRGYNTYVMCGNEITMFADIITEPGYFNRVLDYIGTQTAYIRQIFTTHKENQILFVAVSDSAQNLKYLMTRIDEDCRGKLKEFHCRQIQEVLKDVYGGIKYECRSESDSFPNNRADNWGQDS